MAGVASLVDRAVQLPPGPQLAAVLEELTDAGVPNARRVEVLQARSRQLAHDQALLFAELVEISHTVALTDADRELDPAPGDVTAHQAQVLCERFVPLAPGLTTNGTMLAHLAEHEDLQAQLRAEPERIPASVEEYLRLFTPYRGMSRTARRDVVIGGRLICEGEPIALVYTSANRDEEVFPRGEEFVLDRPNLRAAIPFGAGIHACPGAPLARMMLRMTLEELLARTSSFEVCGEILMARWAEWGTRSVPMRFTPA